MSVRDFLSELLSCLVFLLLIMLALWGVVAVGAQIAAILP